MVGTLLKTKYLYMYYKLDFNLLTLRNTHQPARPMHTHTLVDGGKGLEGLVRGKPQKGGERLIFSVACMVQERKTK
jgi:hypothetical protein